MDANLEDVENVQQIENISLDMVKCEPVGLLIHLKQSHSSFSKMKFISQIHFQNEEEPFEIDPFSGLKEGTHSFIDRNIKIIEEDFPPEPNEEDIQNDPDETNFLQALDAEIDHEMLTDGMQFECVWPLQTNPFPEVIHFSIDWFHLSFTGGIQIFD